jgi:hypothetical protein
MRLGMTVLRVTVGGLFVGHGTQKLFGWFDGSGPEATGDFFEGKLGLHPDRRHALAAGAAEAGGGALLATGFLTPLGAMLIGSTLAIEAAERLVERAAAVEAEAEAQAEATVEREPRQTFPLHDEEGELEVARHNGHPLHATA